MLLSCVIVAVFLASISVTNGSDEKRILLSDPQYISQELTRFQSELQQMQVKYNTQNTELADIQSKYNTQNTILAALQTKYNTQNTELADIQSKYNILAALQTKYSSQNTELAAKYNTLNTELANLQSDRGAVFTRWGRRDCPANITTMVYSGHAGGSWFTSPEGAAEYVCMPNDPIWGPHKDLVYGDDVGFLYGAEYEDPIDMFGMPNHAEDVPCAVCLGTQHAAYLMIPGRTQCYPGWTEVYQGDLASGYHSHAAASQYVCVDGDAQAVPGGGTHNEDGKLFYGVKAKCGALPCPPYEDGKFLSCVVCMK